MLIVTLTLLPVDTLTFTKYLPERRIPQLLEADNRQGWLNKQMPRQQQQNFFTTHGSQVRPHCSKYETQMPAQIELSRQNNLASTQLEATGTWSFIF